MTKPAATTIAQLHERINAGLELAGKSPKIKDTQAWSDTVRKLLGEDFGTDELTADPKTLRDPTLAAVATDPATLRAYLYAKAHRIAAVLGKDYDPSKVMVPAAGIKHKEACKRDFDVVPDTGSRDYVATYIDEDAGVERWQCSSCGART